MSSAAAGLEAAESAPLSAEPLSAASPLAASDAASESAAAPVAASVAASVSPSNIVSGFLSLFGLGGSGGGSGSPMEFVTAALALVRREITRLFANQGPSAAPYVISETVPGTVTGSINASDPRVIRCRTPWSTVRRRARSRSVPTDRSPMWRR